MNFYDDDEEELDCGQSSVWLAVPSSKALTSTDDADPLTCKLGGLIALFREPGTQSIKEVFTCTLCNSADRVQLICQLHAPLEVFDRVLYILYCQACSTPEKAACFAVRSQSAVQYYIDQEREQYDAALSKNKKIAEGARATPAASEKEATFQEDDDWGDDDSAAAAIPTSSTSSAAPVVGEGTEPRGDANAPTTTTEEGDVAPSFRWAGVTPAALASTGTFAFHAKQHKHCLRPLLLELLEEPEDPDAKKSKKHTVTKSAEEQLAELESLRPGTVDMTSIEEDDETAEEKIAGRYTARLTRCPSQCVRWAPDTTPLLCRGDEQPPARIPPCTYCGAQRRFELQLVSPTVYFLSKGLSAEKATTVPVFGSVLVYTCSVNCDERRGCPAYAREYCFVQGDI